MATEQRLQLVSLGGKCESSKKLPNRLLNRCNSEAEAGNRLLALSCVIGSIPGQMPTAY
jgi:hypothetical protein